MRRLAMIALAAWPGRAASGQTAPPATDIYLAPLAWKDGSPTIGPIKNVTGRPGYDNQPYFAPNGRLLYYSSVRTGGPGRSTQSDVYQMSLATGQSLPFTETPESEYSPAVIPGGGELATIRVELDSAQRLWSFPIAECRAPSAECRTPKLLLPNLQPVGYQAWVDAGTVAVFVLGSPPTLQVADLTTGQSRILLSGIGRALQPVPGRRAVSVMQLVATNTWWLTEVAIADGATRRIARMPDGADYFVWLKDGSLLTARGNTVLHRPASGDTAWRVIATIESPGIAKLSRLAVSPHGNRIAFVAEEPTR